MRLLWLSVPKEISSRKQRYVPEAVKVSAGDIVLKALQFIDNNYSDPAFSAGKVAKHFEISASRLSVVFSQHKDISPLSPGAYIAERRIRLAAALLAEKSLCLSTQEAAFLGGYGNATTLSRIFRKRGLSINQMRAVLSLQVKQGGQFADARSAEGESLIKRIKAAVDARPIEGYPAKTKIAEERIMQHLYAAALRLINTDPSEPFSLEDIARNADFLSVYEMHAAFKHHLAVSPEEYFRQANQKTVEDKKFLQETRKRSRPMPQRRARVFNGLLFLLPLAPASDGKLDIPSSLAFATAHGFSRTGLYDLFRKATGLGYKQFVDANTPPPLQIPYMREDPTPEP